MFVKISIARRVTQKFFNLIVQKDLFGVFSVERYVTTSSTTKLKERKISYFQNLQSAKEAAYKELNSLIAKGFTPLRLA